MAGRPTPPSPVRHFKRPHLRALAGECRPLWCGKDGCGAHLRRENSLQKGDSISVCRKALWFRTGVRSFFSAHFSLNWTKVANAEQGVFGIFWFKVFRKFVYCSTLAPSPVSRKRALEKNSYLYCETKALYGTKGSGGSQRLSCRVWNALMACLKAVSQG